MKVFLVIYGLSAGIMVGAGVVSILILIGITDINSITIKQITKHHL